MKLVCVLLISILSFCLHACILHHPGGDSGSGMGNTGNGGAVGNMGGNTTPITDNLTRYRWGLVRFGNTAQAFNPRAVGPSLTMSPSGTGEGYSGCRSFRFFYSANPSQRSIGFRNVQFQNYEPCNDGRTEDRFLDMLKRANRYQIDGNRLTLYQYADELAVFNTVN